MKLISDTEGAAVVYASDLATVLRLPMKNSYAIPLQVGSSRDIEIITWCLVGFGEDGDGHSSCLLVLNCSADALYQDRSSILIHTHVGDRHLRLLDGPGALSRDERVVLTRMVLTAFQPSNAARLTSLLPALAIELEAICTLPGDPELMFSESGDAPVVVGLDFVPACLIARLSKGCAFEVVETIRMRAEPRTAMALTLAGSLDMRSLEGAIFTGNGRYAAARIVGAACGGR